MKTILLTAVAAAFFAVATFGIVTSSNADPEQIDSAVAAPSEHRPTRLDIRIKTDDYLVPAHVCADADAESDEPELHLARPAPEKHLPAAPHRADRNLQGFLDE